MPVCERQDSFWKEGDFFEEEKISEPVNSAPGYYRTKGTVGVLKSVIKRQIETASLRYHILDKAKIREQRAKATAIRGLTFIVFVGCRTANIHVHTFLVQKRVSNVHRATSLLYKCSRLLNKPILASDFLHFPFTLFRENQSDVKHLLLNKPILASDFLHFPFTLFRENQSDVKHLLLNKPILASDFLHFPFTLFRENQSDVTHLHPTWFTKSVGGSVIEFKNKSCQMWPNVRRIVCYKLLHFH